MTTQEQNKALVQRFNDEFWNNLHLNVLDEMAAPDFVHQLNNEARSRDEYKKLYATFSVKGNSALAVSRHIKRWTIEETRENVNTEFRSVWMLTKIRGEWKVTGLIAHISTGQLVTKMRPSR